MLRLITNPRPEYSEDSSDKTKIYNCQQSCFFFSSNPKNSSYFIHRSSIQHKRGWLKYRFFQYFPIKLPIPIKGSNLFIDMSVLYRKKNFQLLLFILKTFLFYINIVVERVPCCVWTSNFSLNHVNGPALLVWLIENQNRFTNESRNAMVLKYDLKLIQK